jgi:hypothetical protein
VSLVCLDMMTWTAQHQHHRDCDHCDHCDHNNDKGGGTAKVDKGPVSTDEGTEGPRVQGVVNWVSITTNEAAWGPYCLVHTLSQPLSRFLFFRSFPCASLPWYDVACAVGPTRCLIVPAPLENLCSTTVFKLYLVYFCITHRNLISYNTISVYL